MRQDKRHCVSLKKMEPLPLPPSLESAFADLDSLDRRHPESRETSYGGIRQHETRCQPSTLAQDER